ncbi:hypothetical protein [Aeromicrobium sp. 179-A 4D2 NHS]|uniref:hypothetical protein n=1 Tax=Aeromicrobium sp. 179-A 4D2 NHS TaxID=3142375 RepID=UPI0039A0F065
MSIDIESHEPSPEAIAVLTATLGQMRSANPVEADMFAAGLRDVIGTLTPEQTREVIISLSLTAVVEMIETAAACHMSPEDYLRQFATPLALD